jgi:methionine-rich copper-binding protein CopC
VLFTFASIVLAIASFGAPVFAHAFLDHSEPRVGETIGKAPKEVKIWFTQQPEPAFSSIKVLNSDGKQIDENDTHPDKDDAKELIVSLPDLSPGTYKVVWHVLSVDTHKTQGDFKFTVQP